MEGIRIRSREAEECRLRSVDSISNVEACRALRLAEGSSADVTSISAALEAVYSAGYAEGLIELESLAVR